MWIIGCDFHARYQQIYGVDRGTGEVLKRRLSHEGSETRKFYSELAPAAVIGMEASATARWFERLLADCGHQLWVGDAARIRAAEVRKQKTDRRDAQHLYELLEAGKFPRVWVPGPAERDLRQLLWHRHKLVVWRTQLQNQLRSMARSEGLLLRSRLWSGAGRQQLEALALDTWGQQRRRDLLELLDELEQRIAVLTAAVERQAQQRSTATALMEQAGVGPITALAFVLAVGSVTRFARSRALVSYLGLNPQERSSGEAGQRLGHISKQGNRMVRWLLVEAAWTAVRKDAELTRIFQRLAFRRGSKIAVVAVARRLAVKLYWRLRQSEAILQAQPLAPMQGSSTAGMVKW